MPVRYAPVLSNDPIVVSSKNDLMPSDFAHRTAPFSPYLMLSLISVLPSLSNPWAAGLKNGTGPLFRIAPSHPLLSKFSVTSFALYIVLETTSLLPRSFMNSSS